MIRALPILLLAVPAMAQDVSVQNPRAYGWWLGDELVQQVRITLPPGAALDPASLPRARAVDYWLDLRAVERQDDGNRISLTLRYQNFYSALEPSTRQVPAFPMRLMDGSRLDLPGFSYVTSPLRPILAPSTPDQLQPDPPYHLIDSRPTLMRLALSGVALLAGLLMALTYIGGELAQMMLNLPAATVQVFQGMLLFFLLGFDLLTRYRIRRRA